MPRKTKDKTTDETVEATVKTKTVNGSTQDTELKNDAASDLLDKINTEQPKKTRKPRKQGTGTGTGTGNRMEVHEGKPELQAELRACRALYRKALHTRLYNEAVKAGIEAKPEWPPHSDDDVAAAYVIHKEAWATYRAHCKEQDEAPGAGGGANPNMLRVQLGLDIIAKPRIGSQGERVGSSTASSNQEDGTETDADAAPLATDGTDIDLTGVTSME